MNTKKRLENVILMIDNMDEQLDLLEKCVQDGKVFVDEKYRNFSIVRHCTSNNNTKLEKDKKAIIEKIREVNANCTGKIHILLDLRFQENNKKSHEEDRKEDEDRNGVIVAVDIYNTFANEFAANKFRLSFFTNYAYIVKEIIYEDVNEIKPELLKEPNLLKSWWLLSKPIGTHNSNINGTKTAVGRIYRDDGDNFYNFVSANWEQCAKTIKTIATKDTQIEILKDDVNPHRNYYIAFVYAAIYRAMV